MALAVGFVVHRLGLRSCQMGLAGRIGKALVLAGRSLDFGLECSLGFDPGHSCLEERRSLAGHPIAAVRRIETLCSGVGIGG